MSMGFPPLYWRTRISQKVMYSLSPFKFKVTANGHEVNYVHKVFRAGVLVLKGLEIFWDERNSGDVYISIAINH